MHKIAARISSRRHGGVIVLEVDDERALAALPIAINSIITVTTGERRHRLRVSRVDRYFVEAVGTVGDAHAVEIVDTEAASVVAHLATRIIATGRIVHGARRALHTLELAADTAPEVLAALVPEAKLSMVLADAEHRPIERIVGDDMTERFHACVAQTYPHVPLVLMIGVDIEDDAAVRVARYASLLDVHPPTRRRRWGLEPKQRPSMWDVIERYRVRL